MFRKIVSQLSFSPALVGQLGFYAKRLRKEQATRRLGLVFVALALVVQSLVVFQPPQAANASNSNDFIPGGLGTGSNRSLNNFLRPYDKNDRHLKDIMNYAGITREEIAAAKFGTFKVGNKKSYGFENRAGSTMVPITADGKRVATIYGRPLTVWGYSKNTDIYAYIGYSKVAGWFAIMQVCGNLVTDEILKPPVVPEPANIVASKTGTNVTQGNIDASKVAAQANDTISYTISVKNTGGTATTVTMKDDLGQVMQYATLTNNGGGTYNATNETLSWGSVQVNPGATISKTYTVKMKSSLISTTNECSMKNNFLSKSVLVPVACSTPPANIVLSKTAVNITQGNVDATQVTAQESDRISFTLAAENKGGTAKEFTFVDSLSDALEYAKIIDNGGGTFDEQAKKLTWPTVMLEPGHKEIRTFTMQLLPEIPATPQGISDASSYDCRIENTFYEAHIVISLTCPAPKIIEEIVPELPQTGPTENMIFAGVVLAVVSYFYFRSRQLGTEVRLIRRDLNGGTI